VKREMGKAPFTGRAIIDQEDFQLDRSLWADYYLSVSIVYLDDIRVGGRAECHVV
jgi:hypothetical protein